eukprot:CAMPEP_0183330978 /NCGR_PEP_ID=MMETSP0164_2-20130417/386_1 /TAXON_ID=221442 /ORGANISM="Coccolithus pelagicus ssp braarudi, Strain PLY182g" /LENGTH=58 /DNA_ID=CAMNT_0025499331 /DNA_START=119 /DNA_END=298 /DNA_ORIENTATION=+
MRGWGRYGAAPGGCSIAPAQIIVCARDEHGRGGARATTCCKENPGSPGASPGVVGKQS